MVIQLVSCLIAILWLLHRATRLLKIPAPTLIQILGIDIPDRPLVSVDAITDKSVSLHWNPPERVSSVVKYIIEVDGKKAGETDRSDFNVTIQDFKPNQAYTIRVLAVNPNNYRSHAAAVRIRTRKHMHETLTLSPSSSKLNKIEDDGHRPSSLRYRPSNRNLAKSGASNGSAVTSGAEKKSKTSHGDGKKDVYTVESLKLEVEHVQSEIEEAIKLARSNEKDFKASEAKLLEELEELRARKKEEDHQRSQVRTEAKLLEDSKRELETKRSKADKRLRSLQEDTSKKHHYQAKWQSDLEEARAKLCQRDGGVDIIQRDAEARIDELHEQISETQHEMSSFEEDIKKLSTKSRETGAKRTATLDAIALIKERTDRVTGLVPQEIVDEIAANDMVDERLKSQLRQENDDDCELERQWQKVQKSLEMRYLDVKHRYEDSVNMYKEASNMYEKQTRNVQSGNNVVLDSLNAAVANTFRAKKKKNRKSRSGSQPIHPTQLPNYSPQLYQYPGPPLADGQSSSSSGMMGPLSQQPQAQAQAQQQATAMATPYNYDYENLLSANQTQALNPSLVHHRSLNQLYQHDYYGSASFLPTAGMASQRASFDSGHELPLAQQTNTRLSDQSDLLLSPTALDVLLPSNLFGADDMNDPSSSILNDPAVKQFEDAFSANGTTFGHASRPSGSILGGSLQNKASGNFGAQSSPKPSILSLHDSEGSPSPHNPSSPRNSFHGFSPFSRPPVVAPTQSPSALGNDNQQSNTARKITSMFFSRSHKNSGDFAFDQEPPAGDNASVNSLDIGPIGSRPRAGSYSSIGSRLASSSNAAATKPSRSLFNPWNNNNDSMTNVNPVDNSSMLLAPSRSNNGSIMSLESGSKFGNIIGVGSKTDLDTEHVDSQVDTHIWQTQSAHPFIPEIQLNSSAQSASEEDKSSSKFVKSFGNLFSSNTHNGNNEEPTATRSESQKSIASLFGKTEEEAATKENVFQKSMRAFAPRKSSTSSTGSGRFKVRSLSIFSKKSDQAKGDEDSHAIMEEEDEGDALSSSDMRSLTTNSLYEETSSIERIRSQRSGESLGHHVMDKRGKESLMDYQAFLASGGQDH
ncbi:hypothetical protein TRVA0_038S00386 [Trichomonascus vanleenenianus]|uniref:uncharacterized protein n=1 Tax=Trichomonascus vanleenenianus TaxID=2268995 RepID=UPI003ECB73C6